MIETDSGSFPVVVEDLDADWLLALVEESEVQSRAAERRKLRYALAWCRLHPAQGLEDAATWGDVGGRDRDCDLTLAGEGAPLVAAFTAEPFATALGVSTRAGMRLLADALDLAYRLPCAQGLVESLQVAPWRARKLAEATRGLSQEAAAYVDRQVGPVLDSCGPARIERLVEEARARFDPVELAAEESTQRASWGIQLRHGPSGRYAGTSWLEITGDTPTLTRFHDLASAIAHDLLNPDHPDAPATADLDQRKVQAVGVILGRALGSTGAAAGRHHWCGHQAVPAPGRRHPAGPHHRGGARRTVGTRHRRAGQGLARPVPGHRPPGAADGSRRPGGPARPTRLDA